MGLRAHGVFTSMEIWYGEETTEIDYSSQSISVGSGFLGDIDELEIYTRGLSVAEIRELAGLYVLDSSGNANHGILIGGDELAVVSGAGKCAIVSCSGHEWFGLRRSLSLDWRDE